MPDSGTPILGLPATSALLDTDVLPFARPSGTTAPGANLGISGGDLRKQLTFPAAPDSIGEPLLTPALRDKINARQIDYQNEIYKTGGIAFTAVNGASYVLQGDQYYNITTPAKPASGRVTFGVRVEQSQSSPATYGFNNGGSLQNGLYDAQTSPGGWIQWALAATDPGNDWTSAIGGQAELPRFVASDSRNFINGFVSIEKALAYLGTTTLHIYGAKTRLKASQPAGKPLQTVNGNNGTIETNGFA